MPSCGFGPHYLHGTSIVGCQVDRKSVSGHVSQPGSLAPHHVTSQIKLLLESGQRQAARRAGSAHRDCMDRRAGPSS